MSLYPRLTIFGLALFIGQAFLYNSILFGFGNLLSLHFHTPSGNAPYYLAVFAVGTSPAEFVFGVKAEGESLERIAKPLTVADSRPGDSVPVAVG